MTIILFVFCLLAAALLLIALIGIATSNGKPGTVTGMAIELVGVLVVAARAAGVA